MLKKQTMKRPVVVWLYSFLLAGGVLFEILIVIGSIAGIFVGEEKLTFLGILIANAIILPVDSLFLYYFFMLKEKAKTWVHIFYGTSLAYTIITDIIQFVQKPETASISYITIIGILIMWWIVFDYIKKKKIEGKLLYSN